MAVERETAFSRRAEKVHAGTGEFRGIHRKEIRRVSEKSLHVLSNFAKIRKNVQIVKSLAVFVKARAEVKIVNLHDGMAGTKQNLTSTL
ncbi:MAG: hypothetical protein IIZ87_05575 [Selenomonas sp.]|nr:hypothetical protein [Selenomonas sp.]